MVDTLERKRKRSRKPSAKRLLSRRVKAVRRAIDRRGREDERPTLAPGPDGTPPPRRRPKQPGRHRQMREPSTQKIYDLHSRFYDATFGRLVKKRIGKAIREQIRLEHGQTVLDVGIGTGASFAFYPDDRGHIVGIDLSGGMLAKAMDKITEAGRENASLARANALQLPFGDDAFESVFVSHVISVVSDPVKLLFECCRVCRPGGRIVIVNHFQSTNRLIAAVEKLLCPICTKLGWRSDLPLHELVEKTGVQVDARYKLSTPDLWETVIITNNKPRAI